MRSIPPDREQTKLIASRAQRPIDVPLILVDVHLSSPILILGDPGQLSGLSVGLGKDVKCVGVPGEVVPILVEK